WHLRLRIDSHYRSLSNRANDIVPGNQDMARQVALFVYPGFALLDLSGPLEAFGVAEERAPGSYWLSVMSIEGGLVASSTGLKVATQRAAVHGIDTCVVVGDFGLLKRSVPSETMELIREASAASRRTASVCMGGCLLAACGLLEGRRPRLTGDMRQRYKLCIRQF